VSAEQPSAVENAPSGHPDDLVGADPTLTTAPVGLDEAPAPTTDETALFTAPVTAPVSEVAAEPVGEPVPVAVVAPPAAAEHVSERRPHGRRVVRVVRRVQLWSVFKVALLSFLVFYGITLLAAAAVWSLANSTGQVHHVEKFMRDIGFDNWTFDGGRLFSATAFTGAVLVVLASVFATLAGALLNLISELTGGIRFIVIEDVEPTWSEDVDIDDDDLALDDETRRGRGRRARRASSDA
jgi:hypothetical protein